MDMADKTADAAGTTEIKVEENTEVKTEVKAEGNTELEKVTRLLEYEREEKAKALSDLEYHKSEAKKAFEKRDKAVAGTDTEDYIEQYKAMKIKYEKSIEDNETIKASIIKEKKMIVLTAAAKNAGLKPAYLDKLELFVDMSEINHDKEVSIEYALDKFQKAYPDLFGTGAPTSPAQAFATPKISGTGVSNIEEIKAEMAKEFAKSSRERDDRKYYALKEKLNQLEQKV